MNVAQPTAMWIVPHTHWDREWYEPHDVFRARLVAMLDELLDLLEREPDYKFTLDGQTAAIDDYLEIRPERTARVRAAVERGQLALGPFQILLDEFCCDGETIIRNLEIGIRNARRFGQEMRVGYLPDMFGHAAQMPQFLRGFGISDACLWRGVPAEVARHAFVWEAPDGSAVRVEYLWDGYGNALKLFEPVDKMPELVAAYLKDNAEWFDGEAVAGWYGTDHMAPRSDLAGLLRDYAGDTNMQMATVGEVISSRDHSAAGLGRLPVVRGELRSHARGNLLPGVFSIRTRVKAAMASAERGLTTAERMDAWLGGVSRTAFFERGWGLVVESTAHDSVTGCGADLTADEVESRLKVARQTADGAIDICLAGLGETAPVGSVAVFNPSGYRRPVQAEWVVEGRPESPAVQIVETLATVIGDEWVASSDLPRIIRRIHGQELFGKHIRSWTWEGRELEFVVADHTAGDFDLADFTSVLSDVMAGSDPDDQFHVVTRVPESSRILVGGWVDGVSTGTLSPSQAEQPTAPVTSTDASLDNSLVRVDLAENGCVTITDLRSGTRVVDALRLVDDGDCGDSYNYGPVAGSVSTPESIEILITERGPLRGRITVRREYLLPVALDTSDRGRRATETALQRVDTVLELRADEAFVRVSVALTNQVRDHRLRIMVPTLESALGGASSVGQYATTARGRDAEGGWGEFPLPTFPATRAVAAGEVGVLLNKLTEYEIVSGESGRPDEVALTVLRSVGLMSVNVHPLRDEPAGSEVPVPGAQYLGEHVELEFAIDLDPEAVVGHADVFRLSPVTTPGRGGTAAHAGPRVQTEGVVPLESLRRVAGGLEARFVNYGGAMAPLNLRTDGTWLLTDLAGSVISGPVDPWSLEVGPGQIVTLLKES